MKYLSAYVATALAIMTVIACITIMHSKAGCYVGNDIAWVCR